MTDQSPDTAIVLGARNLGAAITRDLLARNVRVATIARTRGPRPSRPRRRSHHRGRRQRPERARGGARPRRQRDRRARTNRQRRLHEPTGKGRKRLRRRADRLIEPHRPRNVVNAARAASAHLPPRLGPHPRRTNRHRGTSHRRPCQTHEPRTRPRLRRHGSRPRAHTRSRPRTARVGNPCRPPDCRRHHRVAQDSGDDTTNAERSTRPPRRRRPRRALPRHPISARNDPRTRPHTSRRAMDPLTTPPLCPVAGQ